MEAGVEVEGGATEAAPAANADPAIGGGAGGAESVHEGGCKAGAETGGGAEVYRGCKEAQREAPPRVCAASPPSFLDQEGVGEVAVAVRGLSTSRGEGNCTTAP